MAFINERFDPRDEAYDSASITGEKHEVLTLNEIAGAYGFDLDEVPDPDQTITITRGGSTYTQQPLGVAPAAGEYNIDTSGGTALVLVNASELGNELTCAYYGRGAKHSVRIGGTWMAGIIRGKTVVNGTNPPTVKAGVYENRGRVVQYTSDQTQSASSNNYGRPALESGYYYHTVMSEGGTIKHHLATGTSIVGSLTVNTITNPAGSTFRYNFSGSPNLSGVTAGDIIHITGCTNADNDGAFVIDAVNDGSDYIEVTNADGATQGSAAGTGTAYYPPGDSAGTPSPQSRPAPTFSGTYNGRYSPLLSTYRILDYWYYDGSSVLLTTYGNGSEIIYDENWQAYTPTTQGLGEISNVEFAWRRVGQCYEVKGRFTTGTVSGDEAQIGLPNGATVGTQISASGVFRVGSIARNNNAGPNAVIATPGDAFVNLAYEGSSPWGLTPRAGSGVLQSIELVSFDFSVPIAGLTT